MKGLKKAGTELKDVAVHTTVALLTPVSAVQAAVPAIRSKDPYEKLAGKVFLVGMLTMPIWGPVMLLHDWLSKEE